LLEVVAARSPEGSVAPPTSRIETSSGLGALRFISSSAICLRREILPRQSGCPEESGCPMALVSVWLGTQSIGDIVSTGRMTVEAHYSSGSRQYLPMHTSLMSALPMARACKASCLRPKEGIHSVIAGSKGLPNPSDRSSTLSIVRQDLEVPNFEQRTAAAGTVRGSYALGCHGLYLQFSCCVVFGGGYNWEDDLSSAGQSSIQKTCAW